MNRKFIRKWLAIALALVSLSCFCACKEHEHSYADGWFYDETYHWRKATCDDVERGFQGLHNFIDGVCTLCGYEDPDYVEKPDEPGTNPGDDEPGTEDPKEDPKLPDDDPSSAERPKPSEGGGDPIDPDDEPLDDPLDDTYYDSFFVLENEYTRGQSSTQGGLKYTELLKEGVLSGYAVATSSEKNSESEIVVPATYRNLPVLMVDKEGFQECASLTKITLPDGMLFLGDGAFKGCTSLRTVVIPSSTWLISREAFFGCSSLSEITLPEGVREIRYGAFYRCAFEKLTIPNSVHTVASLAFYECKLLKELDFGTGVKNVGGQAFYGCGLGRVNISDLKAWCEISFVYGNSNPLNCGGGLYLNNKLVTNLEIPEGCGVKKYSFYGCSSIEEVTIPSSAGRIGEGAFMRCSALQSVKFSEGANEIDSFVFGYNYKLTELILPDSMKTIRVDAIYYCTNLSKIVFGKGIALLEMDAFTEISSSAQFYYRGSAADWGKIVKNSSWTKYPGQIQFNYTDSNFEGETS